MRRPRVGVLALQGDVREHVAAFAACGVEASTVRLARELDDIDALALPGGESTTMSRLLRAFRLEDALRRRLGEGMSCFATCAGMILLSRTIEDGIPDQLALGALDISVRRNGYGRQLESFETDLSISGASDPPFHAVFIRAPQVVDVGDAVEVLAELEGRPVAVAENRHVALAFHPELSGDLRLHALFLDRLAA